MCGIDSLKLWNAHFVSGGSEYVSDVVYKVEMKKDYKGYIILLFEHQSTPEKLMPFRMLEYTVFLMRQHLKQGYAKLPIIMPLVFYHGTISPYPYETDLASCFEHPSVGLQYFLKPFHLIDVTLISDHELKQHIITAPMQLMMKYIRQKDLLPWIIDLANSGILEKNAHIKEGELLAKVLTYLLENGEISNYEILEKTVYNSVNKKERSNIMRAIEYYREQARKEYGKDLEEVRQQGKLEEKLYIAKNMLELGLSIETVIKATHLSIEQIKSIKMEENCTTH